MAYKRSLRENRPKLNKDKELVVYDERARKTSRRMARLFLRYMSLSTALTYTENMISKDIAADGVEPDVFDIMNIGRKMVKCQMVGLLAEHFGMNKFDKAQLVELTRLKEFSRTGTTAPAKPASTVDAEGVRQLRSTLQKALKTHDENPI